jgi:hypothetical protein
MRPMNILNDVNAAVGGQGREGIRLTWYARLSGLCWGELGGWFGPGFTLSGARNLSQHTAENP